MKRAGTTGSVVNSSFLPDLPPGLQERRFQERHVLDRTFLANLRVFLARVRLRLQLSVAHPVDEALYALLQRQTSRRVGGFLSEGLVICRSGYDFFFNGRLALWRACSHDTHTPMLTKKHELFAFSLSLMLSVEVRKHELFAFSLSLMLI